MAKVRYRSNIKNCEYGTYVKGVEKRSRQGCLTCRRRRKKCDEIKPRCNGCTRNFLTCKWPSSIINSGSKESQKNGSSVNQKYSFVRVTQEQLSKSEEKATIADTEQLQIVLRLPHMPTGILHQTGEEEYRDTKNRSKNIIELASPLEKKLPESKKRLLTMHSNTKGISGDTTRTTSLHGSVLNNNHQLISGHRSVYIHQDCTPADSYQGKEKHLNKGYFDLQLKPYAFVEQKGPEGRPLASKKDYSEQLDTVSALFQMRMGASNKASNEQQSDMQLNCKNRNNESSDELEKYCKIIRNYDHGEMVGNTSAEKDEDFLFFACIKKFVPNLGTQDTHHLLTACATFTPQAETIMPLKEIFLCCGATYLEWYDAEKFSPLSDSLYKSSQMLIDQYLQESSPQYDVSCLLVAFQLLCLRSKMALSGTIDECVKWLSKSYSIITNNFAMRREDQRHMAAELQNIAYEIENKFIGQSAPDRLDEDLVLQPQERMCIESFIYNYSVAIFFAKDISKLPSPFSIFKELNYVLRCPLYCCYFEWMNNPVVGPALDAFEILAKVSYIGRLPMPLEETSIWYQRAQQLQSMALFYTGPILYPQLKSNAEIFNKAKLSSLVGGIVAKSSYLLILKILNFHHFKINELSVVKVRHQIYEAFSAIPLESKIWGILIWSLIITGCFSTTMPHKSLILKYLLSLGEQFHHHSTIKIRNFLEKTWSRPESERLDILFDREELSKIAP